MTLRGLREDETLDYVTVQEAAALREHGVKEDVVQAIMAGAVSYDFDVQRGVTMTDDAGNEVEILPRATRRVVGRPGEGSTS